ncbi:MAG TPA: hypothetical protein VGJ78_24490 [Vicinamibacterales bacterium]|jgi:hypothetical protein
MLLAVLIVVAARASAAAQTPARVRQEGGRLAYEAHPSGQPSAVFLSLRRVDFAYRRVPCPGAP